MISRETDTYRARLRKLRKAAGLTQNQFADELGVSRRIIDYYEREGHQPPAYLLADLSKVLNASVGRIARDKAFEAGNAQIGRQAGEKIKTDRKDEP